MSLEDTCTNPTCGTDWVACPDCLARAEAKAHRVVTVYYCRLCLQTMGTETRSSLFPGVASAPHDELCRACTERSRDAGTARTERGIVESVAGNRLEIPPTIERRRISDSLVRPEIVVTRKPRRGIGAGATLHRFAHRIMASRGVRVCACGLLTSNQWRPMSHAGRSPE